MTSNWRRHGAWGLPVLLACVTLLPLPGVGQGARSEVLGVTIEPGEQLTRLTIRTSAVVRAVVTPQGRTRVVVLLPDTLAGSLPEELPLDTGGIGTIRVRQTETGTRLELELTRPIGVRQITLPGEKAVVLDVGGEPARSEVFSRPEGASTLTPRLPEVADSMLPSTPEPAGTPRAVPPAGPPAPARPETPVAAAPGLLTAVGLEPAPPWIRLRLETSGPAVMKASFLKVGSPRYVIDLEGVLPGELRLPDVPPGLTVTGLRVGKNSTKPPVTRIVLDLKPGTTEEATRNPAVPTPMLVVNGAPAAPPIPAPAVVEPEALMGYTVALDAGHGGGDPGASGSGMMEKDVTLDVSTRLYRWLRNRGCSVKMSRFTDRSMPPPVRTAWLQQNTSDILVSVHCDSVLGRPNAAGTTTYFHRAHAPSRQLAERIQQTLVALLRSPDLGVRSDYSRYDKGFYMLRAADRPAVLVEMGYISHAPTAKLFSDPEYRQRVADGIGAGIAAFLTRHRRRPDSRH